MCLVELSGIPGRFDHIPHFRKMVRWEWLLGFKLVGDGKEFLTDGVAFFVLKYSSISPHVLITKRRHLIRSSSQGGGKVVDAQVRGAVGTQNSPSSG